MNIDSTQNSPVALGVREVLASSLPTDLLMPKAPSHYVVEAVLSRRVERDESALIEDESTRQYLSDQGYPGVRLHVSDRRLEIHNTNLQELLNGLSTVVANRLLDIDSTLAGRRSAVAAEAQRAADREQARASSVTALASAVKFLPGPVQPESVQVWDNEGGAASERRG